MNSSSSAIEEVDDADSSNKYYPFFNTSANEDIALNAIGTAKVMCRCSGTPGFIKKVGSLDDIKDHGRLCLRRNSKSQKKDGTTPLSSSNSSESLKSEEKLSVETNFEGQTKKVVPPSGSSGTILALSNLEKLKTPFAFSVFWSSVKNNDDIPSVAKALRILTPELISKGEFFLLI